MVFTCPRERVESVPRGVLEATEAKVGWWHRGGKGKEPGQWVRLMESLKERSDSGGSFRSFSNLLFSIKHPPPSRILLGNSISKTNES